MRHLVAVPDAVAVGVGVGRVGAVAVFVEQSEAVVVGVPGGAVRRGALAGVEAVLQFPSVGQHVAVAVPDQRVQARPNGLQGDLVAVGQTVAVGVLQQRIGIVDVHLVAVFEAVVIGVLVERIRAVLIFLKVGQPVVIRVVRHAVYAVGLDHARVEIIAHLPAVGQAVAVGVGIQRIGVVDVDLVAV